MENKKILFIITGGIAAYKSLETIRELRRDNFDVTCVLTKSGSEFVTPLSIESISGNRVYSELFNLNEEHEMGHIQLSRTSDLILVAPATANIISKIEKFGKPFKTLTNDTVKAFLIDSKKSRFKI